jgi:hypothetical protein
VREAVSGPSRQAAFFGPTVANGALRTWLDLQLTPPVAIDTRQPQDGTLKKGLHRPRLNAIIPILTAADSHPDCRALLIQIVALYSAVVFLILLPFVRTPLLKMPAFIASYEAALAIIDLITAILRLACRCL